MNIFVPPPLRGFRSKLFEINWAFVLLILLVGLIGVGMLYSVEGGAWDPYASRHAVRLGVGLLVMLIVAVLPPRFWIGVAYPAYVGALILLVGVELAGVTVMGAQRWINAGLIQMQPSEFMKVALVLALARYYHDLPEDRVSSLMGLIVPVLMITVPMGLIIKQPDLGTSLLLALTGVVIVFMAGLSWKMITGAGILSVIGGVFFFHYGLQDYQRQRMMTFISPEDDPIGAGYHILQSKIALGSGGAMGKGYMRGTQAHLNFLPEKQTDFIFTMLGEEFGFIGGLTVLGLYALILANCILIANSCRSVFLRLVVVGVAATLALYVFINVGMVMGALPVVGVPLPMISYGGTVMMTVLIGMGLTIGAHVHRDAEPPRGASLIG